MIDLGIVLIYLIITLAVGYYSGRKVDSMREFSIANRNFATGVIIATLFATEVDGGATLGIAEEVFATGLIFIFIFLGEFITKMLIAQYIAPRMGRFKDMISVGDMMHSFYGQKGRVLTGLTGTFLCIGYGGAQVCAMGHFLHYILGISYELSVIISCGTVIFYSAFGGIRAVTITDVIQFCMLIITIPLVLAFGIQKVGGWSAFIEAIPQERLFAIPEEHSIFHYISLLVIFCLPSLEPSVTQRLLMARDTKQMATSFRVNAFIELFFYPIAGAIGLVSFLLYPHIQSSFALPVLIGTILPVGVKGFAIAGMLAVMMSSADSDLNAASITFVHDFIKPLRKKALSDHAELRLTQVATILLGFSSIVAALVIPNIIEILIVSLDLWGPVILWPLFAGIFGIKASSRTFTLSATAGFLTFLIWTLFIEGRVGFDAFVPGLFINCCVFFTSHFLERNQLKTESSCCVFSQVKASSSSECKR